MSHLHDRRLMRLIHGELAADEARALERRIARDPALAARHRALTEVWNGLEAPPPAAAPGAFAAGVVAAARRQGGEISWSLAPAWARAGAAAALILGLALGTALGVDTGNGFSEPELAGDQEASLLLAEPTSLAESFWLTLEETGGRLDAATDSGERVR